MLAFVVLFPFRRSSHAIDRILRRSSLSSHSGPLAPLVGGFSASSAGRGNEGSVRPDVIVPVSRLGCAQVGNRRVPLGCRQLASLASSTGGGDRDRGCVRVLRGRLLVCHSGERAGLLGLPVGPLSLREGGKHVIDLVGDVPQVAEHRTQSLDVGHGLVLHSVLLAELSGPLDDLGLLVLGHRGEQVVLNLTVEVAHPPVHKPVAVHVHRVIDSVLSPGALLVGLGGGQMSVVEGEVAEQIDARDEQRSEESPGRQEPPVHGESAGVVDDVTRGDNDGSQGIGALEEVFTGVEVEMPEEYVEDGGDGKECVVLVAQPPVGSHVDAATSLQSLLVKSNEGEGIYINVEVFFLRSGVVLGVHGVPLRSRSDEAEGDGDLLNQLIEPDLSCQGVVTTLVLHPPATTGGNAANENAQEKEVLSKEPKGERKHEHQLNETVNDVQVVGLEIPIVDESLSELLEICDQFSAPRVSGEVVVSPHGSRRDGLQPLVGLL
mmetsp:Transcript_15609/g.31654  ORF Transcript_15609/g.31654 Transcript_15609/m.31654 type:complete len:491 (-) Transcript_15609:323-1795(-)